MWIYNINCSHIVILYCMYSWCARACATKIFVWNVLFLFVLRPRFLLWRAANRTWNVILHTCERARRVRGKLQERRWAPPIPLFLSREKEREGRDRSDRGRGADFRPAGFATYGHPYERRAFRGEKEEKKKRYIGETDVGRGRDQAEMRGWPDLLALLRRAQ